MKGYAVHLLFHLVAIVIGSVCGLASARWWLMNDIVGLWLACGALAFGVAVLALQALYIAGTEAEHQSRTRTSAKRTIDPFRPTGAHQSLITSTRPDLEPISRKDERETGFSPSDGGILDVAAHPRQV